MGKKLVSNKKNSFREQKTREEKKTRFVSKNKNSFREQKTREQKTKLVS